MNAEEIRQKKAELEQAISELLSKFEQETDTCVEQVNVRVTRTVDRSWRDVHVTVDVSI